MADSEIIVSIKAEGLDKFNKDLKSAAKSADKLGDSVSGSSKKTNDNLKKSAGLVNDLNTDLAKLKKARDAAFDEKEIKKYNAQIAKTEKKLDKLTNTNKKVESSFSKIGKVIGGAFAAAAVIEFGKAMVKLATQLDATEKKIQNSIRDRLPK